MWFWYETYSCAFTGIADRQRCDANPDPDPDPTFSFDTGHDPTLKVGKINIDKL